MGILDWFTRPPPPWLERASGLAREARYGEAITELQDSLIDTRALEGKNAEGWRAAALQLLAECRFDRGEAGEAIEPSRQALLLFRTLGDRHGVRRCLESQYEAHRWLGRAPEAAALADEIGWRRQAEIVRAGEPLNRVVVAIGDRLFELPDAPPLREGRMGFVFRRNRRSTGAALHRHRRGMEHGAAGRFEEALSEFRAAADADRFDPDPHYQAAATLLYLRRGWDAVAELQETEARAPGWFHCRAELRLAERIASGGLPYELFPLLRGLESAEVTPNEKVELAEAGVRRHPGVPQFHIELGRSLRELGRPTDAEEWFRRGLAGCDEPDARTRLLLELAMSTGPDERAVLLREAVSLGGNLVAAAQAALLLR